MGSNRSVAVPETLISMGLVPIEIEKGGLGPARGRYHLGILKDRGKHLS